MKYFENLDDLNISYYLLFADKANAIDYLGKRFSRKIDKEIMKDYRKSLKLYKKIDKIRFNKENRKINKMKVSFNLISILKTIFNKKK